MDEVFEKDQAALNEGVEDNYFVEVIYRTEGSGSGVDEMPMKQTPGQEEIGDEMGGGLFD